MLNLGVVKTTLSRASPGRPLQPFGPRNHRRESGWTWWARYSPTEVWTACGRANEAAYTERGTWSSMPWSKSVLHSDM